MPHAAETGYLQTLFVPKACARIFDHAATGTQAVTLKENAPEAKLKRVTITRLGEAPFCLLPETGQGTDRHYSPLLAKGENWFIHQACDAVLFLKKGTRLYEVFIELKSDSPKGCSRQFQATEDFLEYAWRILKTRKQHNRLQRTRRHIVLNTRRNDNSLGSKQGTHPKNFPHDNITYVKISNGEILTPADFC
jgi:hypothetical protein